MVYRMNPYVYGIPEYELSIQLSLEFQYLGFSLNSILSIFDSCDYIAIIVYNLHFVTNSEIEWFKIRKSADLKMG